MESLTALSLDIQSTGRRWGVFKNRYRSMDEFVKMNAGRFGRALTLPRAASWSTSVAISKSALDSIVQLTSVVNHSVPICRIESWTNPDQAADCGADQAGF